MSLCWPVQVKYTSKSKTSIPATMEGSAQLQPRLQGFLPPTSTWGVVGFHVVDNWVLQGCYNALVGFLEGCNEVVHLPKEPPGDPRRCLQSQRGEVRRAAGYPVLAHRPRPQKCTQLPGKEPAMEWAPDVPVPGESLSHTALLSPGHPSLPTLSSSQQHGDGKVEEGQFLHHYKRNQH